GECLPHAPGAAHIIRHGHGEKDDEGDESSGGGQLGELGGIADVHEKEDHEAGLNDGNGQRHDRIENSEFKIGSEDRKRGEAEEDSKDSGIDPGRDDGMRVMGWFRHGFASKWVARSLVSTYEIEQWKQEYPH